MDDKMPLYSLQECLSFVDRLVEDVAVATVGKKNISKIKEIGLEKILGHSIYAKLFDKKHELYNYVPNRISLMKAILDALKNEIVTNWISINNKVDLLGRIHIHVKTKKLSNIADGMSHFQNIILPVINRYIGDRVLHAEQQQKLNEEEKTKNHEALVEDINRKFQYLNNACIEIYTLIIQIKPKNDDIMLLDFTKRKFQEIKGNINGCKSTFSACLRLGINHTSLLDVRSKIQDLYQALGYVRNELNNFINKQAAQSSFFSPSVQPNSYTLPLNPFAASTPAYGGFGFFTSFPSPNPFFAPLGQQSTNSFELDKRNLTSDKADQESLFSSFESPVSQPVYSEETATNIALENSIKDLDPLDAANCVVVEKTNQNLLARGIGVSYKVVA